MAEFKQFHWYAGTIRHRRTDDLRVKPEAEQLEGKRVVLQAFHQLEDDDSRYPGEWALGWPHGLRAMIPT